MAVAVSVSMLRFPHEGEKCEVCNKGIYFFVRFCGAYVCVECNNHRGLAKCYCGWGLAPGEKLEDDVDYE